MDAENRFRISYYKEIAVINGEHCVSLVQHIETGRIYVKKLLGVYNLSVYEQLKENPIAGVPRIFELWEADGVLTVIEEYVSGETLDELLLKREIFDTCKIRHIMLSLCGVLKCIHAMTPPVIHRDIKPSNIILTPQDNVCLIDFSAAKNARETGGKDTRLLGTEGYAAPEQYGFGASDIKTDIYGAGALLKELLEGCDFKGSSDYKRLYAVAERCLKLEPESRYRNAEELEKAIKNKDRSGWLIGIAAAILLISAATGAFWALNKPETILPEEKAAGNVVKDDIYTGETVLNAGKSADNKASHDKINMPQLRDFGYSIIKEDRQYTFTYAVEIYNPNSEYTMEYVNFSIAIKDAAGKILRTGDGIITNIPPGDSGYAAMIDFVQNGVPASAEITISQVADTFLIKNKDLIKSDGLVVTDTNEYEDAHALRYTGVVENKSAYDAKSVTVYLFYRKEGKITGGYGTYISGIVSGGTIPFELPVPCRVDYDSYEFHAVAR